MPAPLELTDISDASIQSTNGGEGRAWQIPFTWAPPMPDTSSTLRTAFQTALLRHPPRS